MKNNIREIAAWGLIAAVWLCLGMAVSACGDKEEDGPDPNMTYDFAPMDVVIKIVDENGVNLLSETEEGNWLDRPFEMSYNSKSYGTEWLQYLVPYYGGEARWDKAEPNAHNSRALPATFIGLRCVEEMQWVSEHWEWKEGDYLLAFGEFPSDKSYSLEMDFIVPGNDTPIRIEVVNSFRWERHEPIIDRIVKVDEKEVSGFPIKIVLPRIQAWDTSD